MKMYRLRPILLLLALVSCEGEGQPAQGAPPPSGDSDELPLKVRLRCPGGPGCEDQGDGKLYAGVARRDITPLVERFEDRNNNQIWDPGEPYDDRNGNGLFDAYWIAGFDLGRIALGVHDPVWARALAMRQNQTTVVVVAVDTLGLFSEETAEIRKLLDPALGVDLLLLHATHVHQAADLTGGWGQTPVHWGVNEAYRDFVRRSIAAAVAEAVQRARPARVTFGAVAVEDGAGHDMSRYVADSRDPVVIDNVLHTLQFSESLLPHAPIATLVNWSNHPEAAGGDNQLISSDFVHYVRERVERRGGTCLYVSGSVGGLLTPLSITAVDEDGRKIRENGFPKAEALGRTVGNFALQAMADPASRTLDGSALRLAFRDSAFKVQVHNRKFQLAAQLKTFRRAFCCYDEGRPVGDDNVPWIDTQVAYVQLGPASILTNPGELFPELFIGGYKGEYAGTYRFLDAMQKNAPDLNKAPPPPYLIDEMEGERAHRMIWGLTGDFVGYIMPRYTFLLDPVSPYLKDAPGDHYEETNSLGHLAEPHIVGTMRQLVRFGKDAR